MTDLWSCLFQNHYICITVILGVCHTLGHIYGRMNLWQEMHAGVCLRQRSEVMSEEQFVPFIGVSRHRMATDGNGVTTLAAFHGCRLGCRYCLNPQCRVEDMQCLWHTPETLYEEVRADELYFLATGGGITFGGGEPLLYSDFIVRFRELCGPQWKINVETSLNVAAANVEAIADVVDTWFIDVKDLDADIYRRYTGHDNAQVIDNLSLIAGGGRAGRCVIRLPLIPGYNTDADRTSSEARLRNMGFEHFDKFNYEIP